jgi:hypothetical protein
VSIEQAFSAPKLHAETERDAASARNKTMMMRFTIEQRPLTGPSGRPAAHDREAVSFHHCEAESAGDAIHQFLTVNGGNIVGEIVRFPGLQAVGTVRLADGVYTLQVTPSSQNVAPLGDK